MAEQYFRSVQVYGEIDEPSLKIGRHYYTLHKFHNKINHKEKCHEGRRNTQRVRSFMQKDFNLTHHLGKRSTKRRMLITKPW